MQLKTFVLGLGLCGAIASALVGVTGLWSNAQMAQAFDHSVQTGLALQSSQQADMMHDAIRGDVLTALVSAQSKDSQALEDARKDLGEHAQAFQKSLQELRQAPLSTQTRVLIDQVSPALQAYVVSARNVLDLSAGDAAAAQGALPAFQKAFKDLEVAMERQSEAIEAEVRHEAELASASVIHARWQVAILLLLASGSLLAGALWLTRYLSRPLSDAVQAANALKSGNLDASIHPVGTDETRHLLQTMAEMQRNLSDIVASVQSNAQHVASGSIQIAQGNRDLSTRTESQASALEQTAASMEELGSTVRQNADSAREANQLVRNASSVAQQGGEVVGRVVQTMRDIQDSSRRIADILGVIDGIAFQTNILALNAAVEAARAGEQGRGFAVVAGEVRALAGRSAEAAREIKSLITASVQRVEQGTSLVDQAGSTMTEVVDAIQRATDLIGRISHASDEQAAGVAQVGEAIAHMDRSTQQNAAMVEEMAAAAGSLQSQADDLVRAVSAFRLQDRSSPALSLA